MHAGLNEVEDAYEEDKQRGHNNIVSIADKRSAQQGKEEAQDAQKAQGAQPMPSGKGHSNSNGSSGSLNDKGRVSSFLTSSQSERRSINQSDHKIRPQMLPFWHQRPASALIL